MLLRSIIFIFIILITVNTYAAEQLTLQSKTQNEIAIQNITSNSELSQFEPNATQQLTDYLGIGNPQGAVVVPDVAYDKILKRYIIAYPYAGWNDDFEIYSECRIIYVHALTGVSANISATVSAKYGDYINNGSVGNATCSIATNTIDGGFIVVSSLPNKYGKNEIKARRFDVIGLGIDQSDFDVSDIPENYQDTFSANRPSVVFNLKTKEYFVTWERFGVEVGDDLYVDKTRIDTRRIPQAGGLAANVVTAKSMGEIHHKFNALDPSISYNEKNNEYLLAFSADGYDVTNQVVDVNNIKNQRQVHVQRLELSGQPVGNSIKITDQPFISDSKSETEKPVVTYYYDGYGSDNSGYYLVWYQYINDMQNPGFAVFGKRLNHLGFPADVDATEIESPGPYSNYLDIAFLPRAQQYVVLANRGGQSITINRMSIYGKPIILPQTEQISGPVNAGWGGMSLAAADFDLYYQRSFFAAWAGYTQEAGCLNLFSTFLKPKVLE